TCVVRALSSIQIKKNAFNGHLIESFFAYVLFCTRREKAFFLFAALNAVLGLNRRIYVRGKKPFSISLIIWRFNLKLALKEYFVQRGKLRI
ncbi:MAG: hypothetical protein IJ824_00130, partial [Alphaproteobacteria bacterium]|nr:hypothetical protein [Alphaproteobacteria bacterium]